MNEYTYIRTTPLAHWHSQQGAHFLAVNNAGIVAHYGKSSPLRQDALNLGLVDLTPLSRIGIKGADAYSWLKTQHIVVPELVNQAQLVNEYTVCACLSPQEYFVFQQPTASLDLDSGGHMIKQLSDDLQEENIAAPTLKTYLLFRDNSHSHFILTGNNAIECLSKVCGVDVSDAQFPVGSVAQTAMARCNVILLKMTQDPMMQFHIFVDSSYGYFLWLSLLDAMQEWDGGACGIDALTV